MRGCNPVRDVTRHLNLEKTVVAFAHNETGYTPPTHKTQVKNTRVFGFTTQHQTPRPELSVELLLLQRRAFDSTRSTPGSI